MAVTERSSRAAEAVDDLYRRHGPEVYRYALAVLGNRSDAEDVTQSTFLNAYRSLEQGVRPRKPGNWLLAIASNTIKQRFRQESARPQYVLLDDEIADAATDDDGPSVGELLTALSRIPPQQRQAIVLREFEGRSYKEIANILGVTTTALETLLFRARRSLADELEHQLTCTEAQLAISRAADSRLGRKERRRLRTHLDECPDCAHFLRLQQRHRRALRGLTLIPVPISLSLFRGLEGTATAATLPAAASAVTPGVVGAGAGAGLGTAGATGGGVFASGVAVKAAAVVAAASVASGTAVVSTTGVDLPFTDDPPADTVKPGSRLGRVAPRGVSVPGRGVARGKPSVRGQTVKATKSQSGRATRTATSRSRATVPKPKPVRAQQPALKPKLTRESPATAKKETTTGETSRSAPAAASRPETQAEQSTDDAPAGARSQPTLAGPKSDE